jgi:hypothetical protein
MFRVMYPSRDSQGMGTINIASRRWDRPYRERGFWVSGHAAPSFLRLKQSFELGQAEVGLTLYRGTVTWVMNARGPLGPDRPTSDASLHPLMLTDYTGVKFGEDSWALVAVNTSGDKNVIAEGAREANQNVRASIRRDGANVTLSLNGKQVWAGELPLEDGHPGIIASENTTVLVDRFALTAEPAKNPTSFLYTEALVGAAQNLKDWEVVEDTRFRYGVGAISSQPDAMVKWNVEGKSVTLWAPRGPRYGRADLRVNGKRVTRIDFHAENDIPSAPVAGVYFNDAVPRGVTLHAFTGAFPVDALDVAN